MKHTLNLAALYWTYFERFELRMSGEAAAACSHSGSCDDDVAHWAPLVAAQVEKDNFPCKPTPELIRAELKEYGAWDAAELADDAQNWQRLVWLAAGQIVDDDAPDCTEPVSEGAK